MMEKKTKISDESMRVIKKMQQNEITEAYVYRAIAKRCKDKENRRVLEELANEEEAHYHIWRSYSGMDMQPEMAKVRRRSTTAALFGFTFVIKLMEKGEVGAQDVYEKLSSEVPEAEQIQQQEEAHENRLIGMLDEERLQYVGSMVLGLNDALVELTGTLAGLTLAMANTRLIALSGLITGISATLSMASSEFLSAKSEGRSDALKSCGYTGVAYLVTVALLILPYLLFDSQHYLYALFTMLGIVLFIIVVFNYYISVAKDLSFKKRFGEMAGISLGVAALSFVVGLLVKGVLGVDI